MKKWISIGIVAVVAAVWLVTKWGEWQSKADASGELAGRTTTAIVETRSIHFAVTVAGEIGPAEQVSVKPEINGRILTLPVDLGDQVKKGDILFTLDDSDLQIERQSRLTEIEGAKLQVAKAERNYERSRELYELELISKELYEDTKTEWELAKNMLARSQENLNLLTERLTKTTIRAPFNCTVLTRPVSIGQAVSGSGGFNSGTEVLTIADLNNMIVNAHINQADVTRLGPGQKVDIQVESVPGLALMGTVERIAPQAIVRQGIKGYPARIFIKTIDPRVRPGMTANLSIPVASSDNAVAVPLAAVFTEQGDRFAYVKNGGSFERRSIRIGIADFEYAEVLDGLQPGETVSLESVDAPVNGGKRSLAATGT